tara:strand:+ start:1960 stop:3240 length:1281 start_codon:yes stop_codon:yes gene_type:complete
MAKVKLHLDKRTTNKDNLHPLVIQLAHKGKTRTLPLKIYLNQKQWKENSQEIIGLSNSKRTTAIVRKKLSLASDYLIENSLEIELMEINELKNTIQAVLLKQPHTTQRDVERYINGKTHKIYLKEYSDKIIERLNNSGRFGYVQNYKCAITSILKFNNNENLLLSEITVSFLRDFEAYQLGKGNSKNTIGAYLRPIRAMMNQAIQEKILNPSAYPFNSYTIPVNKRTKKRAVEKDVIIEIRNLKLEKGALRNAKNYLLFIFNNRGINLIDIAKLKKHQIINAKYENGKLVEGRLEYIRSKTKKNFSIKLTQESLMILNEYNISEKGKNDLIFPIGYVNTALGRSNYDQNRKRINGRFKILAEMVGFEGNMTTYVIRHSWATIAKKNGVPISVIGESLGHEDYSTTETYLDSFDHDTLDDANELVVI